MWERMGEWEEVKDRIGREMEDGILIARSEVYLN